MTFRCSGYVRTLSLACAVFLASCSVKPAQLTDLEIKFFADDKISRVTSAQAPVTGPIDLYEAIARALKYNLDHRIEIMQTALKVKELNLANYQGLPNVILGTGYTGRSNVNASSSENVFTGVQSLAPSTSQDRHQVASDLAFSWNILDFGLSYVRAQQAADQALIADELRRKIVIRLVEDVRTAYWRAIASERLLSRLQHLEGRTRQAIANARQLYTDRLTSPLTGLTHERELVEIKREVQRIEGELKIARMQLAALMNVNPAEPFRLVHHSRGYATHNLGISSRELVRVALENRPEMREVGYRLRINEKEAEAALLELLPNIGAAIGAHFDSNSFLVNQNWLAWSAKVSWNLLKLFQYPARKDVINAHEKLLDQRALAVTMSIILQVHASRARYAHARKELATAWEFLNVQRRLLEQMRASAGTERVSEQTLIREEMNTLVAEVRYDLAYANLENAYAAIYGSLGLDPIPQGMSWDSDLRAMTAALRQSWVARGMIPKALAKARLPKTIHPLSAADSGEASAAAGPTESGAQPTIGLSLADRLRGLIAHGSGPVQQTDGPMQQSDQH